jgi:hypothetical protein
MQRNELARLVPGQRYVFHTQDFEVPTGGVMPGEAKVRTFVREETRGCEGCPKIDFLVVRRDNGTEHLIARETLRAIEPA